MRGPQPDQGPPAEGVRIEVARSPSQLALAERILVHDAPDLPAVAFTSDDSRPGFERMGFLAVSRFTLWQRTGG